MKAMPSVDPEMAQLVAILSDPTGLSIETHAPVALRDAFRAFRPAESPEVANISDDVASGSGAPDVPIRIYEPSDDPLATILFFHGGGWVLGSIDDYDDFTRRLALATMCRVVSVEYRLAPEHRFPAAVDDAWTAFTSISARYGPLFVAGDSAGGNLAAVVAQQACLDYGKGVAGQLLFYPSVAGDIDAPAMSAFVAPVLTKPEIAAFYDHYIPDRTDRTNVLFAPARANNLEGLAPALVITAEADLLAAEAEEYASRMGEQGVAVELHRQMGAVHTYLTLGPEFAATARTLTIVRDFVSRYAARSA